MLANAGVLDFLLGLLDVYVPKAAPNLRMPDFHKLPFEQAHRPDAAGARECRAAG